MITLLSKFKKVRRDIKNRSRIEFAKEYMLMEEVERIEKACDVIEEVARKSDERKKKAEELAKNEIDGISDEIYISEKPRGKSKKAAG